MTKTTGADGTITLNNENDGLSAGQYKITEVAVPEGYIAQTKSQFVTIMPNSTADCTVTFYNAPVGEGEGSIRKVDSDNPTMGLPGAVIKITSVKLDDGGSFTSTYVTGDGGYISEVRSFAVRGRLKYRCEQAAGKSITRLKCRSPLSPDLSEIGNLTESVACRSM